MVERVGEELARAGMRLGDDVLSFISTTMVFGTPVDVTLSELALETFFPADDLTAQRMRTIAAGL